ncbi:MAG TPA: TraB/GumN family protein, partial [Acidimicrobiia bacterium]|nr:TraB/GumN family protein [Acidimicrobiia bacterium]
KRGLLYEIKTGAATVYLFGTLHVGKPEFYPLGRETNRALTEAQKLYLEVNLTDPTIGRTINEVAIYPDGESLERTLPPALMARVDAALERYKLPRASAVRMKPWMLGQTLLLLEATRRGYDPAYATEMYLLAFASGQRKDVLGLETLAEQFALFDGMPAVEQQRFLEEILTELGEARMATQLDALVDAWAHADARGLEIELMREKAEATAFARDVLPRVIDERNRTMAEKIVGLARGGTTTFVAVGALHLVGPDGIVEILRRRGFAVRQL